MKELQETELQEINGGSIITVAISIGVLAILAIGILDGYTRPLECN